MKAAYLILVFLHGLIHLIGFVKGLDLKEVKSLSLPVSKPLGILWLAAAVLFTVYGVLYAVNYRYAWMAGLVAVAVSQVLVIQFWPDAKFGTVPNLIVLAVTVFAWGNHNFEKSAGQETRRLLNQNEKIREYVLSENDITDLPVPVKKWLKNSGAVGKPVVSSGKVTQRARLQMRPDQDWMSATAVQHTTISRPAFIWKADVKMNRLINFQGRDKFEDGKGAMLIKLNGLINVVNERGEKLDEGTLQRFLGEMVWFPSMAAMPYITWEPIDDSAAKATMSYRGTSGSGTFRFHPNGDVAGFSAMRYRGNDAQAEKQEWTMNISAYKTFEGIRVPAVMSSTWKTDEGDWTWLKLEVTDLTYRVYGF